MRNIFLIVTLLCFSLMGMTVVNAASPSYNYSYWGETVPAPEAYLATKIVRGKDLGVGLLLSPSDIHINMEWQIYILDSGNNRIVVTDSSFNLITVIDSFINDGRTETFLNPQGLYVTDDNHLYIADTDNNRVVHLDQDFNLINIIESPEYKQADETFLFRPARVVVDSAGRIYVKAIGVFDGLMEFGADGTFRAFIGANRVFVNPAEYFWRLIATREQRRQMMQFIPTEFTNMDIDENGFIYATNADRWGNTIRKINALGNDILRRDGYVNPRGDVRYHFIDGPSRLIDIHVTDSEIYSVLDSTRGRIFTYNGDGYLLYVFGGLGNQIGQFNRPIAIERLGDNFLVLDNVLGEITVFEPTEYGVILNKAIRNQYQGNMEKATELFRKISALNANFEFAYDGIGNSYFRQGEYYEASIYFRKAMDRRDFSTAFLRHRRDVLRNFFPIVMTGLVVLLLCIIITRKILSNRFILGNLLRAYNIRQKFLSR